MKAGLQRKISRDNLFLITLNSRLSDYMVKNGAGNTRYLNPCIQVTNIGIWFSVAKSSHLWRSCHALRSEGRKIGFPIISRTLSQARWSILSCKTLVIKKLQFLFLNFANAISIVALKWQGLDFGFIHIKLCYQQKFKECTISKLLKIKRCA